MGEMIWCDVDVVVPASWVTDDAAPWFVDMLNEALCNGHDDREARPDGAVVFSVHGEGNYGLWDSDVVEVLDALTLLEVPYVATQDTKYEIPGELRTFTKPGGVRSRGYDADRIVCDLPTAEELGDYASIVAYLSPPDIRNGSSFEVDHLADELPGPDDVPSAEEVNADA